MKYMTLCYSLSQVANQNSPISPQTQTISIVSLVQKRGMSTPLSTYIMYVQWCLSTPNHHVTMHTRVILSQHKQIRVTKFLVQSVKGRYKHHSPFLSTCYSGTSPHHQYQWTTKSIKDNELKLADTGKVIVSLSLTRKLCNIQILMPSLSLTEGFLACHFLLQYVTDYKRIHCVYSLLQLSIIS